MKKRDLSELDAEEQGSVFRKAYRWNTDLEFFSDTCELIYDVNGTLIGTDYRKAARRDRSSNRHPLP